MRLNGFQGPGQFPRTLEAAKEAAQRVMAWEDALERDAQQSGGAGRARHAPVRAGRLPRRAASCSHAPLKYDTRRPLEERKRTRLLLGVIEKSDHRYAEAETVLRQALDLPPSAEHDAKVLYVLGRMYASWGRPEQARVALHEGGQVLRPHLDRAEGQGVAGRPRQVATATAAAFHRGDAEPAQRTRRARAGKPVSFLRALRRPPRLCGCP